MEYRDLPETGKYYSASAIIKKRFLGDWMKSIMTFLALLRTERGREVFKPITKEFGSRTTYKVKGETLLEVIDLIERGELKM